MDKKNIEFIFNNGERVFNGSKLIGPAPSGLETIEFSQDTLNAADGLGEEVVGEQMLPRFFTIKIEIDRQFADETVRYFKNNKIYKLTLDDRYIEARCTRVYLNENDGSYVDPILEIDFKAMNPLFYNTNEFGQNMAGLFGGFRFPYRYGKNNPVKFGVFKFDKQTNFANDGDMAVGMKVVMRATRGIVQNIKFKHLNTGEVISAPITLQQGEKIELNTKRNEIGAVFYDVTGKASNIYGEIDPTSTFFNLAVGTNNLEFEAEIGETNLDVFLYYSPAYFSGLRIY